MPQTAKNFKSPPYRLYRVLEGQNRACSAFGNHSLAILKVSEKYEELVAGLEDICTEAKDLEVITVREKVYKIQFFLFMTDKPLAI